MKNLRWIAGGVVAGAIGAAVWGALGYFANYELGIVAWGIGFCVGFGVRFMSRGEDGGTLGFGAASIAVLAILAGKYAAVAFMVAGLHIGDALTVTPEKMIMSEADGIAEEWAEQGKKLKWPAGMTIEEATEQKDYPPDVWQAAAKSWAELGQAEQDKQMGERQKEYSALAAVISKSARGEAFKASFTPFDILWFILAVASAYKVGSGWQKEGA